MRECYHRMIISVHKVDTDDEFADVLTKAIPKEDEKFGRFCATLTSQFAEMNYNYYYYYQPFAPHY